MRLCFVNDLSLFPSDVCVWARKGHELRDSREDLVKSLFSAAAVSDGPRERLRLA